MNRHNKPYVYGIIVFLVGITGSWFLNVALGHVDRVPIGIGTIGLVLLWSIGIIRDFREGYFDAKNEETK